MRLTCTLICLAPLCAAAAQTPVSELKGLAKERLAHIDGEVVIPGLDSAVEVRRDGWGIPHIYARTKHDLFLAQGYVAAQDRLFQMDLWMRVGEGRLAEVLGPSFVERDRFARLLKYRGDTDAEWASYAPDTREIVTAFVAGVNAYITQVRLRPPIEFTLLGFLPEHWTPDVPLQRMAALSMTGNAAYEVLRAQVVRAIGVERAEKLLPTIPHRDLDPAPGLDLTAISLASLGAYSAAVGPVRIPRVVGSNNWVVNGSLTETGKPLLANDPHRYLDNPSLRYITHLVGAGWDVIGAGEPGVPGIAAGHNQRIGFGFTIVGMDQQDVYVETLRTCDAPAGRCFLNSGAWKPVHRVVDTIRVKNEPPRIVTLDFTQHGPIVSEEASHDAHGRTRAFVLRFVGSEPGTAGYLAQLSVDRATDWSSFLAAAERWKLPTENLVYADVDGNIGWIAAGLMPKRHWSGLLPVPGTGGYEWTGFRRVDELPRSFNPPSGLIVTANHDIRPPGYNVSLNYEFATSFRARRITEVLGRSHDGRKLGVSDLQRLQHDELSLQARTLVPILLRAAERSGRATRWEYATLAQWDCVMAADQPAPLLFETWKQALSTAAVRRLTDNDASLTTLLGGSWLDAWESPEAALRLLAPTTRDTLMIAAMDSALDVVRTRLGTDTSQGRWGTVHKAAFPHAVAAAFNLGAVPRGGDGSTVNATGGADYQQEYGASYREVLDVSDWDRSTATSVPGQSGQPESEYYGNLLPLWAGGNYFPLAYSRSAVERDTKHILWMKPATTSTSR